jgi:hypothetical protein
MPRLAAVQVDRERIFRHVGVIHPEAVDVLALGPRIEQLQVLAQPIGEHLRTRPAGPIGAHHLGRPLLVRLGEVEAQQPALDHAVEDTVRAFRIHA